MKPLSPLFNQACLLAQSRLCVKLCENSHQIWQVSHHWHILEGLRSKVEISFNHHLPNNNTHTVSAPSTSLSSSFSLLFGSSMLLIGVLPTKKAYDDKYVAVIAVDLVTRGSKRAVSSTASQSISVLCREDSNDNGYVTVIAVDFVTIGPKRVESCMIPK